MSTRKSVATRQGVEVPQAFAFFAIAVVVVIVTVLAWKLFLAGPSEAVGKVPPGMPGGPPATGGVPAFATPAPGAPSATQSNSSGAPPPAGYGTGAPAGAYQSGAPAGATGMPQGFQGPPPGYMHGGPGR